MMQQEFYARIVELIKKNEIFAVVHLLLTEGSTPNDSGSKMIVHKDRKVEYTIGGGAFEAAVIADAVAAMASGKSLWKNYVLSDEEIRMRCGGSAYVYIEVHVPALKLILFGGGHVAHALVEMAYATGQFRIMVIDDRPEYATILAHPKADECVLVNSDYDYPVHEFSEKHFIAIITKSHDIDVKVLRKVLHVPHAYLGMIGSKKKIKEIFEMLTNEGISQDLLKEVHAPIGLPIGGKSPGEIAVSIIAEMLTIKKEKGL
jgi:xanthine dehydrogenase accessory factor